MIHQASNRRRNNLWSQPLINVTCLLLSLLLCAESNFTLAFSQQHHFVSQSRIANLHDPLQLGLYEEDIDWDADLFGKLSQNNRNNDPPSSSSSSINNDLSADDKQWDMGDSNNESTMQ